MDCGCKRRPSVLMLWLSRFKHVEGCSLGKHSNLKVDFSLGSKGRENQVVVNHAAARLVFDTSRGDQKRIYSSTGNRAPVSRDLSMFATVPDHRLCLLRLLVKTKRLHTEASISSQQDYCPSIHKAAASAMINLRTTMQG